MAQEKSDIKYAQKISFVVSESAVKGVQNMIDVDMNCGSKGKYIYPVVNYSSQSNNAITGFAFIQNEQATPNNYTKIDQDLNEGAGGSYNYLCVTTLGDNKVTEISFVALDKALKVNTYLGYNVFLQDLNTGAKKTGKYIYLLYKTNK